MNSRSQPKPFSLSSARCRTPKRCCSSMMASPSSRKRTPSWMSAWVPITRSTRPPSISARSLSRSDFLRRELRRATLNPAGSRSFFVSGEVLLGQDLGRGHERGLRPGFDRDERSEDSDDGLSGTDVALKEPAHRSLVREVIGDGLQGFALGAGEAEGKDLGGRPRAPRRSPRRASSCEASGPPLAAARGR